MLYTPQEFKKLNEIARSKGITLILRKPRSKSKLEIDDVKDCDLEISPDEIIDDNIQPYITNEQSDESADDDYVDSQGDNYYLEYNDSWYDCSGDSSCHMDYDNGQNNDIR